MNRLLVLAAILLFAGNTQAVLTEDFEDDTVGQNPTEDWYTYSDSGSNVAVTDTGCSTGNCLAITAPATNSQGTFAAVNNSFNLCLGPVTIEYVIRIITFGTDMGDFGSIIELGASGNKWQIAGGDGLDGRIYNNAGTYSGVQLAASTNYNVKATIDCSTGQFDLTFNNVTTITQNVGAMTNQTQFIYRTGGINTGTFQFNIDSIVVTGADPTIPQILTFTSQYGSVRNNTAAHLSWTTLDAATCTASGGWTGSVPTEGTLYAATVTGSGATDLTLTCTSNNGGTANSTISINVLEQLQIAGPNGFIFGGDRASLAEAAHVSETALGFLFGVLFVFIFGLIGFAAAGLNGGLGGGLTGLIISLAIGILPVWFLFLIAAAFLLLLYSIRRGASNGI